MFAPTTRFLVVDDFATMRKIVKKILNDMSYTNIIEAVDGKNALDILVSQASKNEKIDVIISDWNMPVMLGIDLLKHCRQTPEFKEIPFILVTAESESQQIVEAVKAGVSEYVIKPFSPQVVKEKIEKVYKLHSKEKKGA